MNRSQTAAVLVMLATPALAQVPATQPPTVVAALTRFSSYTPAKLKSLPALPVERFAVPNPGVDFMRARVEETYEIQGVGTDTVGLSGWIAVRHDPARVAAGQSELRWGTAQIDTEFVGLELQGHSRLFGRVKVVLDNERASRGVVGYWPKDRVPEQALMLEQAIAAAGDDTDDPSLLFRGGCAPSEADRIAEGGPAAERDGRIDGQGDNQPQRSSDAGQPEHRAAGAQAPAGAAGLAQAPAGRPDAVALAATPGQAVPNPGAVLPGNDRIITPGSIRNLAACKCAANLFVRILLPDLDLELTTDGPVYMHSVVQTIPPVGYTATVSLTPAKLLRRGAEVGVLRHAAVTFRELVSHVPLDPNANGYYAMSRQPASPLFSAHK